ncbi:MAG: helix-turn-helix transcriptional regulator [Candidatus Dormiibacterota bacterium]
MHWDAGDSRFTVEEYRVVRRVVLGYTDREIALELFMSDSTVRYHLRKVFARFGIRRRIELVQLLTSTTHESEATADLDVLAEV